jgi:uncharacterized protein YdeI (YjbR/CyaY-like superfamily)
MTAHNVDPKVDAYIAGAAEFARPILTHLRKVMHGACPELVEAIKWGIPHFDYRGEMMCIVASGARHCSFTFYKQEIMSDVRLRENPGMPAAKRFMGRLTSVAELPPDDLLVAFIQEAMELNENHIKLSPRPSQRPKDIVMPMEFSQALAADGKAKDIFEARSASFRREYLTWIAAAKTEATRQKRVAEAVTWIGENKGRFWKYERRVETPDGLDR